MNSFFVFVRNIFQQMLVLFFKFLFICLFDCAVLVALHGLSLVALGGGYSLWWFFFSRSMGSRCEGFRSCSAQAQYLWHIILVAPWRVEIFQDQRLNGCPLHWKANSYTLCHQGSPQLWILFLARWLIV